MSTQFSTITEPGPGTVVVALGANLESPAGPPAVTLQAALDELEKLADSELVTSPVYRTRPVNCPPGTPEFLNAVTLFSVDSAMQALSFLHALQTLELRFGRQRQGVKNAARSLDLDLIVFGPRQYNTPELVLPHPRARQRRFVLEPLADIAPHLVLPGDTVSVHTRLQGLR